MNERWLGIPLPIWVIAMAGAVYFFATKDAGSKLLSVVTSQTYTTPALSIQAPAASGAQPGTMPPGQYTTGMIPKQPGPSIIGPGVSAGWTRTGQIP